MSQPKLESVKVQNSLYPEHLKDLESSGITIDTANKAGLRSVDSKDLAQELGFFIPASTTGLCFPYDDRFSRYKLFPPLTGDNSTMKYAQSKGSGVRLYVPPHSEGVLGSINVPLAIAEGEKKTLKASQEGIHCLGVGGLWNWLQDGKPIADLDQIAWVERSITIVPDSDVWSRQDLILPVYLLGVELKGRGADVIVCIIPQEQDEGKLGLDDYLVIHGRTGFDALKKVTLRHEVFSAAREWHKERGKHKRKAPPPPDAAKLLDSVQEIHNLHPAQDFVGEMLWFGIPAGEVTLLVNSARQIIRADQLPDGLFLDDRGFDLSRFTKDGITKFLAGEAVSGTVLVEELRSYFQRYLLIRNQRIYLLLAVWTMGTYAYRIFRVYPYLSLRSPTKECGKSRTEDLLSVVCFNASARETSPTEATLFRGPARNGGTILLDEVEGLRNDRDRYASLLSILNSGFESGGCVTRMERRGEKFVEVSYPTYCPRVLAGINRLANTLEGRAITIFMERKLRAEKVERFSRVKIFNAMKSTRDRLYIWALSHAGDLAETYEAIDNFPALDGLGDRERDLWEPLVSIALLCDAENGEERTLTNELCKLALDLSKIRAELDTASVMQVLETLEEVLNGRDEVKITPTELLQRFKDSPYFEWLKSAKGLAGQLGPLGIISNSHRHPETGKTMRLYKILAETINDCRERYGGEE